MSKGIVLFAFGDTAYYNMAYNMALSIKATSNQKVALVHDLHNHKLKPMPKENWEVFDKLIPLKKKHTDAGQIKCNMYQYMPYDENLYLDVDGCALKSLDPLMDEMCSREGWMYTQVNGSGGKSDDIPYSIWATNDDIWEFFGLEDDSVLPAIQSSMMFIRKCDEAKEFYDKVSENYAKKFPMNKLTMQWGGSTPDELIYSGTMAQFGINDGANAGRHIYFGWKNKESISEVYENFYVLAIYGGRNLVKDRYITLYDRHMHRVAREQGRRHMYKAYSLLKKKHANG